MKKTILIIICLVSLSFVSHSQNVHISDVNFKKYLIENKKINTNGDKEIQVKEAISYIGKIDCSSRLITDLTGIETFIKLTELNCSKNLLKSLDVSKNTELMVLNCSSNQITSLNVSKNKLLLELNCSYNLLTSLDVSKNTVFGIQNSF